MFRKQVSSEDLSSCPENGIFLTFCRWSGYVWTPPGEERSRARYEVLRSAHQAKNHHFFTHNLCGRCNSIVPHGWTDGFSYNTWQLGQGRANTVISSEIKLHTALLYYHNLKACYIILKYQLKVAARQYSWIGILKSKYFYILKMHIYLCKQGFIWINMNAICRPDFEICEIKYDAFIFKKIMPLYRIKSFINSGIINIYWKFLWNILLIRK